MSECKSIKVKIFSYNCLSQGENRVISNKNGKLVLEELNRNDENQVWELIPNLTNKNGVYAGGFTLCNTSFDGVVKEPKQYQQIGLQKVKDVYGDSDFCWTIFSAGHVLGETLWAIQSFNRGFVFDADKGNCNPSTKILFWKWHGGENQKWVVRRIN